MKPAEYKHIAAWGRMMGSFGYYIESQQQKAAKENAPASAIYKHSDGHWETSDDLPEYHSFFKHL